jgi:hypothetical protein
MYIYLLVKLKRKSKAYLYGNGPNRNITENCIAIQKYGILEESGWKMEFSNIAEQPSTVS